MTKWTTTLLALLVLVAVSVHASPITNDGATNKVMARQEGTAPSAEVVTAAPAAPPAAAAAEEEDDDDDDDDDDYDLTGGIDDDDDDDDDEAEDDDDDDDDYIERFFDDILADDDDDDDEKPAKPSTPAVAVVTSAPTVAAAVIPEGEGNAVTTAPDDDYDEDDEDEDASTEGQQRPALGETDDDDTDDDDEEEEEEDDEAAEKDEGDDDEDDDDEDNDLADDDDDTDLLDSDEDIDDVVSAKSARALGAKSPKMPAAHLSKYNRFVDSIIGRINDVLKKSFDPVTVRLTRGSPPPSRRPVKSDPKHNTNAKIGEEGPTYELVAVSRNEDLPLARSSTDNVDTPSVVPAVRRSKHARRNKNKANKQNNRQRARATLIGLASLRRDGDVTVNSMSEHTTVRSRFLLGPLVLRVEKQFGRGAKKELRSATATTDKMTGRMVLRVNSEGVAKLHSIRVLQPKQVRVESEDNHDRTREFVWRRSSHIASLVSQKLTKAARDLLQTKPEPAERQ